MFTLYRAKHPTGGFRAVAGQHLALSAEAYTRHDFTSAAEAYKGCNTDAERKVVLLIDADACRAPGKWVRIDKGDGIETDVSREEVFEKLHAAKVFRTGAELRRVMAVLESAATDSEIANVPRREALAGRTATDFARYQYRRV